MKSHNPGAPQGATFPDPLDRRSRRRTATEVAHLLADLAHVPYEELPPGAARDALVEAIHCGEIDGLYRPLGASQHNVTLSGLPPDVDPRVTVAQWAAWWNAGNNASDELLATHAAAVAYARALWLRREAHEAHEAPEAADLRRRRGRARLATQDALGPEGSAERDEVEEEAQSDEQLEGPEGLEGGEVDA